jgi:hypothetical protein
VNAYLKAILYFFERESIIIAATSFTVKGIAFIEDPLTIFISISFEIVYYDLTQSIFLAVIIEERNSEFIEGSIL